MHLKRTFFAVKEKPRNSFSWLILYFPGAKYMLGLTIKSGRPTYSLGCHVMICSILDDIIFLLRKNVFGLPFSTSMYICLIFLVQMIWLKD